jgi:hypothetical protein
MKEIRKITTGFVTQRWDAQTGEFLGQEFTCGDQVDYEDENGNAIDDGSEPNYQPFTMNSEEALQISQMEKARALLGMPFPTEPGQ